MMASVKELLERVKAASGPDRQLDVDLAWALEPQRYAGAYWNARTGKPGTTLPKKLDGLGAIAVQRNCAEFSSSIDAALALTERLLPGHSVLMGLRQTAGTKPWARVGDWKEADATGANLSIAILTATILALMNKG